MPIVAKLELRGAKMPIVAKLDELGKPAWIALMILGFVIWWPVGLATLAFIIGSGRMSCWKGGGMSRWHASANNSALKCRETKGFYRMQLP